MKKKAKVDYQLILTAHGKKRINQRVMSLPKYATSDETLLADMALKRGKRPPTGFKASFAGRPDGFDSFSYKAYGEMIYCYGIDGRKAYLLTVYRNDYTTL